MTREEQLRSIADKWEQLTIANDQMFSMVMENDAICLELLRRIFPELVIDRVKRATVQKQVNAPLDTRTVRFDAYIRDDQRRTYIVEMQVANHDNLPYRLRYYLEQADHNILGPGDSYAKLKDYPTYVIFFCDFDYYQQGRAEYRFEWRCTQDTQLTAGTGQQLVVFNAKAASFRDNIGLAGFLQLMHNQVRAGDRLVEQITNEMTRIKQDPGRRRLFMKYEMDLMDARSEGKRQAIEQAAKMLINLGMNDDQVIQNLCSAYHLSKDEAVQLLESTN